MSDYGWINDAALRLAAVRQLGEKDFATGDFYQLFNPANAADERIFPLFEKDSRAMREIERGSHRGFVVNINHIREVVPWFKSSYQLRMNDKKQTEIPVSRAQTKRLRELFNL